MKLSVVIHEAEEGGFWAEVPVLPGCVSLGDTMLELIESIQEVIEGYLSVDRATIKVSDKDKILELAV
jgi:predicted RNase H-like HicB family nuclease